MCLASGSTSLVGILAGAAGQKQDFVLSHGMAIYIKPILNRHGFNQKSNYIYIYIGRVKLLIARLSKIGWDFHFSHIPSTKR